MSISVNNSGLAVTAAEIAANLKNGESPLDFINKNLRTAQNPLPASAEDAQINQIITDVKTSQQLAPDVVQPTVSEPEKVLTPSPDAVQPATPAVETPTTTEENILPTDDMPDLLAEMVGKDGKLKSLAHLRKKAVTLEKAVKEKDEVITTLSQERDTFKQQIEEIPVLKERLKKTEYYEKLYDLEGTPEYKEKFLLPKAEKLEKLHALGKQYELPPEILNKATKLTNKRERNQFLVDHFDELGAIEAKELIEDIQTIEANEITARQEPARTLEELRNETEVREAAQITKRITKIGESAHSGWTEALTELTQDALYPELTIREDAPEHNQYSRQILDNASSEYGKFVNLITSLGVKELPKEAAKIIAKRFQLSEAALVMAKSREHHYTESKNLLAAVARRNNYNSFPVAGGIAHSNSVPQIEATKPKNPGEAAKMLLNSITGRK
jgi:hypothetical protein